MNSVIAIFAIDDVFAIPTPNCFIGICTMQLKTILC